MSKRHLAAAALLLLPLTACGGDEEGDRATTVTAPKESSPAPSQKQDAGDEALDQQQLEAALLTVADLPTGYKQGTVTPDDDSPTQSDNPECAKRFDELDRLQDTAVAEAEAAFEGPGLGTILEQSLASFESADEISDRFEDLTTLFSECPSFSVTDEDGAKSDVTIRPLSFPKLGDETVAFALGIKTPDFEGALNIVSVRVGKNAQLVSQGGLSTDAAALEQAARKGTDKLQAAGR